MKIDKEMLRKATKLLGTETQAQYESVQFCSLWSLASAFCLQEHFSPNYTEVSVVSTGGNWFPRMLPVVNRLRPLTKPKVPILLRRNTEKPETGS